MQLPWSSSLHALVVVCLASLTRALPHLVSRASPASDTLTLSNTTILQFVLLLENVENTFYHTFMDMFDDAAFESAGFPPWVRGRFVQIVEHEDIHNAFIRNILGPDAPARCTYQLYGPYSS